MKAHDLLRMQGSLFGFQFGNQAGDAIDGLLIQHPASDVLQVPNSRVDFAAMIAHEIFPHWRDVMFMNSLRAAG